MQASAVYRHGVVPDRSLNGALIFVHIAKTAGTSFSGILDRNFRSSAIVDIYPNHGIREAEFRSLPAERKARVRCVRGHFDYGIHEGMPPGFRYVTFLRDPLEQVRSRYHHARVSRFHPLHGTVRNGMSLEEFASRSPDNYQTRTLAGVVPTPGAGHAPLTDDDLRTARDNIERHFDVVGITERFDESLLLIRESYDLQRIRYVRRNVRRGGTAASPSGDSRRLLEEHCRHDLVLYAWCRDRLRRALDERGEPFRRALDEFREANRRYSVRMRPLDTLSRRILDARKLAGYLRNRLRRQA